MKKFGTPEMASDQDHTKVQKTSQRATPNMVEFVGRDEFIQDELGADMMKRGRPRPT